MRTTPSRKCAWILGAAVLSAVSTGCQTDYNGHGISYGCDGSGAGIVLRWGTTARQGMRDAGFKGIMEQYRWQTGAGVAVDHLSSPAYKKQAAKGLTDKITSHRRKYPNDPIYLAGLSAGCAVVLYALEGLPQDVSVDQVVLLSSSVSADYDLRPALAHVRGRLYNFTSVRDAVLGDLVSRVGTADGKPAGTDVSGVRGFHSNIGSRSGAASGGKVQNIAWRPEFARYGHNGGHTDVTASAFIKRYVAPLIVPAPASAG